VTLQNKTIHFIPLSNRRKQAFSQISSLPSNVPLKGCYSLMCPTHLEFPVKNQNKEEDTSHDQVGK
jgi:hypothetical protein